MVGGYEKHQARVAAVNLLGKDLARRAKRSCELCTESGVSLSIYEVEPVPTEPDPEHCLMLCETCREQLEQPKKLNPHHWHCLSTAIWSELPVIQVTAVRILRMLDKEDWANDLLEQVYLSPEAEAWLT